ncbi:WD40 repeat protein [Streptosporangium album]|uniref:WD40 repeat protein n=1 Tax=Streptosporangium album TaxID=47479 RepID=A0A7W7W9B3_9ACTN|nr:serine/threonine-protein kinase [Streptosporangium album]MBB4937875.1 WD40 repeat protein [Streptosporangium album]
MDALQAGDPDRIGGYWLAGRLGAGGQGVVYEAYDADGARVALKVLHAAADAGMRDRLRKEVAAARRVASFCTARVIDADPGAAAPYIVSEYVEGLDLRRAGRRFAGDDLHRLATAVATALTAIHEAGVVHRDLKPDNVLLGPDGPRLIDFGVARTAEMSLTADGLIAGTPTYMAPELLTGQRAGPAADVFAWGAVMVFAATGEDPFRADDLGAVLHRVLSHDPDLSALPPGVRPLVAAALNKDPARRPAARDLLLALAGAGEAGPLSAGGGRADALRADGAADPALGALAEDAYAMLGEDERAVVPELLLRLVALDADGLETVRRVPAADLLPERPEARRRILDVFGYLLAERDGKVAISRPAVLRAWPRLRAWVDADRDGLPVLTEINQAAHTWDAHGRRNGDLLQGSRLQVALGWAATGRRHLTLTPLERDFLAAASGLTRRRTRRRRLLTMAMAVLLVLSLAGGAAALYQSVQVAEQRDRVAAERDQARGRELARVADGLRTVDPVKAMLLSVAAWRLAPGPESRSSLTSALYRRESAAFQPPPGRGAAIEAVSGDGLTLAAVGERGVRVYEVATGRRIAEWTAPRLSAGVGAVGLSRSGRLLAAVISDGVVVVWETRTGRLVRSRKIPGNPGLVEPAFGDHDSLMVLNEQEMIWDVDRDRVTRLPWNLDENRFTLAPSGKLGVTVRDGRVRVWRLPGLVEDRRFPTGCGGPVNVVRFSADSRFLICGGERVELWDTATGSRARQAAEAQEDQYGWYWTEPDPRMRLDHFASGVRLSADTRLAAGFSGTDIRVWDVQGHREILTYQAPGEVSDIWFAPDGRTLRYGLGDRIVSLGLRSGIREHRVSGVHDVGGISPDARWLAVEPEGSSEIRLWDIPGRRFAGVLPEKPDTVPAVLFDPQGKSVAVVADSVRVDMRDVATRRSLWTYSLPQGMTMSGQAFSADGTTFAAAYSPETGNPQTQNGYRLRVWDARTGRTIRDVVLDAVVGGFVYMPDGRTLASALGRFVDTATGKSVGVGYTDASDGTSPVAVDPAGARLAARSGDGRVTLWDVRTFTPLEPDLRVGGKLTDIARFSPHGEALATIDDTEALQLWDTATRQRIGEEIRVYDDDEFAQLEAAFSPDGAWLRLANVTGSVYDLPVAPDLMATDVCARAGRTLTRQEWREHLGGVPYRDVCAAW